MVVYSFYIFDRHGTVFSRLSCASPSPCFFGACVPQCNAKCVTTQPMNAMEVVGLLSDSFFGSEMYIQEEFHFARHEVISAPTINAWISPHAL